MKQYFLWVGTLFLALVLTGCGAHRQPSVKENLVKETWKADVDTNSNKWLAGTDAWFMNGDPHMVQRVYKDAPPSAATSTMKVNIPDGRMNVKVDGDFQVQIFGAYEHNSMYLFGENEAVRGVKVYVTGNTIYLTQEKNTPKSICDVVIRIGLQDIGLLHQKGAGRIEARGLRSSDLFVKSCGRGNVYLAGNMNLTKVDSSGDGSVTAIGVIAPNTDIDMCGKGSVNLKGNVGLRSIHHKGSGDVNVIGLNSDGLKIYAVGKGKIGLQGIANVKEIDARNRTRVLMYNVSSDTLNAYVKDYACIGLAGYANNLYVDASQSSCFEGKDLVTQNAYVSARGYSHINARATNRMFASATDSASVYFFGPPQLMSQFVSGNGVIIPIFAPAPASIYKDAPVVTRRVVSYKDEAPPMVKAKPKSKPMVKKNVTTKPMPTSKMKITESPVKVYKYKPSKQYH